MGSNVCVVNLLSHYNINIAALNERIEVEERVLAQEERLHRLKIEKDKLKVQLNKLLHDMRKAQTSDHSASGGETLEVVSEGQESGSQPQNMHVEKIKVC